MIQRVKETANRQNTYRWKPHTPRIYEGVVGTGVPDGPNAPYHSCFARCFDLHRNSHPTVPPVRRRMRVACLDGFFALCRLPKSFLTNSNTPCIVLCRGCFYVSAESALGMCPDRLRRWCAGGNMAGGRLSLYLLCFGRCRLGHRGHAKIMLNCGVFFENCLE